ncbi:MAG: hypothetical protein KBC43_10650 [Bacteroidales bacterium]|nr:hypothetical protein [Bacteroidales bacterium]
MGFGICLEFGAWNLGFVWNLVLGIWDLFGFWCLEFGICLDFGAWNLGFVWILVLGIWDLFGIWILGFGISVK